jgi:hypothetical protein
MNPNLP